MNNPLSTIQPAQVGLWLLGFLFIPATLFFQPNLGGEGMSISHNISVWIGAVVVISSALLLMLKTKQFRYPKYWLAMAALPISMIILGFIVNNVLPTEWLFRQLYILGGFVFLMALFQFRFTPRDIERGLMLVLLCGSIHALYGISQIFWPNILTSFITPSRNVPYSTFQQINIHASFQATVLMIGVYLLSRPVSLTRSPLLTSMLLVSTFLSSFIVAFSGSRVGIIGAAAGLLILTLCHWQYFWKRKSLTLAVLVTITAALFMGSQGIERSSGKLGDLTSLNEAGVAQSGSNSRINIYNIAIELFRQQPLSGYGIGSFQKVWHDQKVDYLDRYPEANLPPERLSHPHNELMFWLVEGGLIAVSGIFISVAAILYAAFRCGWRRGLSYTALLLPIGLHTQVELPFYISNIPWFLMLFLVFIILHHRQRTRRLRLSRSAEMTMGVMAISLTLGVTAIMIQTVQANQSIIRFLNGRMTEPMLLQPALNNPFFRDSAELYLMRTLLLRELNAQQGQFAPQFIEWAEPYIEYTPIPQLYIDLSRAYLAIGDKQNALRSIDAGLARYPKLTSLQQSARLIKEAAAGMSKTPPQTADNQASKVSTASVTSQQVNAPTAATAPTQRQETLAQ
ncbi:Wzy polymerase domain-containing protein [Amphritea sp. 1_MG-2023]|uniref:PglL family O-oligosaccharyltransferase n=1 Tax=Amphritea sp. 1_MG-2023 TaxID=3062670 RepID=UPI0026E2C75F|nr:O-antigen ligase family protein [Amphritea sp. 1_MG-2023]MDO6563459.1 Wzy polymerase domain-containing protein [Amphritea sp. 1_MG-2023]